MTELTFLIACLALALAAWSRIEAWRQHRMRTRVGSNLRPRDRLYFVRGKTYAAGDASSFADRNAGVIDDELAKWINLNESRLPDPPIFPPRTDK